MEKKKKRNLPANAGDIGEMGPIPEARRLPGGGVEDQSSTVA